MKRYYIVGTRNDRIAKRQDLDSFDTLVEACKALAEYRLAYGKNWTIDVVFYGGANV